MPAAVALQAATIHAAQVLGVDDQGVIEAGKRADIVAVPGNPLEDIKRGDERRLRDEGRRGLSPARAGLTRARHPASRSARPRRYDYARTSHSASSTRCCDRPGSMHAGQPASAPVRPPRRRRPTARSRASRALAPQPQRQQDRAGQRTRSTTASRQRMPLADRAVQVVRDPAAAARAANASADSSSSCAPMPRGPAEPARAASRAARSERRRSGQQSRHHEPEQVERGRVRHASRAQQATGCCACE